MSTQREKVSDKVSKEKILPGRQHFSLPELMGKC
jgi:hypothetical protein